MLSAASTGWPCQVKRPVAPKLRAMDGHASAISTLVSVSSSRRCSSRMTIVPSPILISEKDVRPRSVRAQRARQRLDIGAPVGASLRPKRDADRRPDQHNIGDLDMAHQQRERNGRGATI